MEFTEKITPTINAGMDIQKKFDDNGDVPKCHMCGLANCYVLKMMTDNQGKDYMLRNFLMEKEGPLCVECFEWLNKAGDSVTKLLHVIRKIQLKLRKTFVELRKERVS